MQKDIIYRQAAVELAMKYCPDDDGAVQCDGDIRGLLDELENLPAVQPDHIADIGKKVTISCSHENDLISRRAAIDLFPDDDLEYDTKGGYVAPHLARQMICELPSAQPEAHWVPCSERLPGNRVCVIVCFREWQQYAKRYIYSIVTGWYARKHSVRENVFNEWKADCDYDEYEDEFYIHEGWYEFTTQGNGDLMNWYINAEVIAWMPLPEPYRGGETE